MNRNSFYYHFKDKQDLIIWIFDYEFIQKIQYQEFTDAFEFFEVVCEYFSENRDYYIRAFEIRGQNCFSEYFTEIFNSFFLEHIAKNFVESEKKEYYAKFATDMLRMTLILWLNDKKRVSPHELSMMAKDAVFAISERCYDLFSDEIEKRKKDK